VITLLIVLGLIDFIVGSISTEYDSKGEKLRYHYYCWHIWILAVLMQIRDALL